MGVLGEIFKIIAELKKTYNYDFNLLDIHAIADFRRNEFIFYGKKAIREFIRRNEPYKYPYRKTELSAVLNRAIMQLWTYPQLFSYYDDLCTNLFNEIKYGSE